MARSVEMHKMLRRMFITILLLALLSGCAGDPPLPTTPAPVTQTSAPEATATAEPAPTETPLPPTATEPPAPPTATFTPAPVAYGPSGFPVDVNPLSGLAVGDPALLERRPLAVKVQLFPRGQRPPFGVSLADVVYDYYQNFGLTRLHAIFLGQDAQTVGPVRSARLLDIQLVDMYKTIFVFGSAEQRTYSKLFGQEFANRLVVEGNANCPPMCRTDPNGYNFLVTNTAELNSYAATQGASTGRQNLDGMHFNPLTPSGGLPGQQASVRFSISAYTRWDYDPASGRYLRSQDVQEAPDIQSEAYAPAIDGMTNQQIGADNVVLLFAPHRMAFGTKPGISEVVQIELEGSGPALAFRDGQVYQVEWHRPTADSVLFLTFPQGVLYPYKPGKTWYEVVGKSTKITDLGNGLWHFQNLLP